MWIKLTDRLLWLSTATAYGQRRHSQSTPIVESDIDSRARTQTRTKYVELGCMLSAALVISSSLLSSLPPVVTSNKKVAKTSQNCVALQSIAQKARRLRKEATCARAGCRTGFGMAQNLRAETRSDLVPLHTLQADRLRCANHNKQLMKIDFSDNAEWKDVSCALHKSGGKTTPRVKLHPVDLISSDCNNSFGPRYRAWKSTCQRQSDRWSHITFRGE